MNVLRQSLSFLLIGLLALPVWGASDVIGSAVSSRLVTLRDTPLTPGSTIFSGDSISAAAKGGARIALLGGDRVELLDNSSMRLTRERAAVEMVIERGSAYFQTVPGSSFKAVLEDATIRPASGAVIGLIHRDSPNSAVVFAQRGALNIRTEHDGDTTLVSEGSAARITLLSPQNSGQTPQPAGRSAPGGAWSRRRLALIVLIGGGGALIGGLIAASHEPKLSDEELGNLISPTKL